MKTIRKREGFEGQRAIIVPKKILYTQCETNPIINEAYITNIGYYPKAKYHYCRRPNGIDQHILIYCAEGKGHAQVSNTNYQVSAGEFLLIPAHTPHFYAASDEAAWTIYWLHFKGRAADAMTASIINKFADYKGFVAYNGKRENLFEELYFNLERGYSNENILYVNMCLWHFIASFHFDAKYENNNAKNNNDTVSKAISFMQNNLGNTLTLHVIAQHVNLSISHFLSIFHKKTGFSPIEYFNYLKIQKACQYLQFTDDRLKVIAGHLGIEDCYYFSRMFKKLMGISPSEYRKRFQKQ
jgi:AraC-like DNA-binding protein